MNRRDSENAAGHRGEEYGRAGGNRTLDRRLIRPLRSPLRHRPVGMHHFSIPSILCVLCVLRVFAVQSVSSQECGGEEGTGFGALADGAEDIASSAAEAADGEEADGAAAE